MGEKRGSGRREAERQKRRGARARERESPLAMKPPSKASLLFDYEVTPSRMEGRMAAKAERGCCRGGGERKRERSEKKKQGVM